MTDPLDVELTRRSLGEMAPRFKVLSELAPDYVRNLEAWQAKARAYGDRYVRPKALEIDRRCARDPRYFDWELVRQSTPYGFLSMAVPTGAGGAGQLSTTSAIVLEELCAACSGVANIFGANLLGVSGVLFGLDFYHFDRALAALVEGDRRGEPVLFAAAITEPGAGSDVEDAGYLRTAKLSTQATPVPDGYRVNGTKVFISNGSVARYTTLIAPLDKRRPVETQTALLVEQGTPGFSVGRVEEKMGMKACPAAELIFDDCHVPRHVLIGQEGQAVRFIEIVLGASRGPVGAIATGTARGAFERVVDYAKRTRVGGRRLLHHQWVQLRLADMARRIHAARQLYLDSCMSFDFQGLPKLMQQASSRILLDLVPQRVRTSAWMTRLLRSEATAERTLAGFERLLRPDDQRHIQQYASMAKITGSDLAVEIAYEALQIVGPEASLQKLELEKIYRDAKLTQIYEGTNQLNRHNIFINAFPQEASHGA